MTEKTSNVQIFFFLDVIHGNNQKAVASMAKRVGEGIRGIIDRWPKRGKEIQILGPAEAPLAKLKGKYRWQILIKGRGTGLLHYFLKEVERHTKNMLRKSGVNMIMDVDPYQML